jgi:FAD dependent oxidoreductase TIGR03364
VRLFDANDPPEGASVRNFGTLWPIGQPAGPRRRLALASLAIWREVLDEAQVWSAACGSLHVAYRDDELGVLDWFAAASSADGGRCRLLTPEQALGFCPHLRREGLAGALWSPDELQVDPRQTLRCLRRWLEARWGVGVHLGVRVTACGGGSVRSGSRTWPADRVWIAAGDDLRTLYPDQYAALGMRRCKLQMMRTGPAPWSLGPILAAGLTLGHYESFAACPDLPALKLRLAAEWPRQVAAGVHVLASQHEDGHLVIGDSHEYDGDAWPFDKPALDDLVLNYLQTFVAAELPPILERWHGMYVRHPTAPYVAWTPEPGVTAITGLGGHGMTLSFGLAEELVGGVLEPNRAVD